MDRAQAGEVFERLAATYPDADCELDFADPFQLLVATVLSAQSTDVRVNMVTPALFARYPTPEAMAGAERDELEDLIRSTGFFHNKATSLLGLSRAVADEHDGVVPVDMDALVALPGVGRKTANVVRGHAFGLPAITTDTHVLRVSARLGWSSSKNPEVVEQQVGDLFDPSVWTKVSDTLIFHGRRCCHAKKAACGACPVDALCPSYGVGVTDPADAAKLVKR
ncbi:endonuclease III [Brooklawnia cerclae]|uniref:Endonuclease III n=1 Tax=Brooklawnia cerclae TaxID=349934 RepID=A0ABX0SBS9_9ACTN|nr:endonuclease III [Brooklawnia cerclae]NIH55480.1 endonuclease-3 [Brooklawnia cerclae]